MLGVCQSGLERSKGNRERKLLKQEILQYSSGTFLSRKLLGRQKGRDGILIAIVVCHSCEPHKGHEAYHRKAQPFKHANAKTELANVDCTICSIHICACI